MEYVISLYVYVCYMLNYMCMGMLGGKGGGGGHRYGLWFGQTFFVSTFNF